ncbi:MAG: S41 family peptidase [Acidobacteria bacterium]|nr:S41 family peptidase [Acidobacteriota bacterium]
MRKHLGVLAVVLMVLSTLAGGVLGGKAVGESRINQDKDFLFKKFSVLMENINRNAIPIGERSELVYSAIRQFLQQLDPHSNFFTPKEYNELQEDNSGRYFGLGIRIRALTRGSGRIVILEPPFPGTPAFKVGLQAGDVIYKVNGESIDEWDVDDVIDHLKGPKGTQVHITVLRPGEARPLEIDVTRDEIPKLTINFYYRIRPGIGYVKVEHFSRSTWQELRDALGNLDEDNLEGLILDLRDNPGGYLDQAIRVSQEFLHQDAPIVTTRDRDGSNEENYTAKSGGNVKLPVVVLQNGNSASASEIVAGAVQDNDRGLILGERSFGKGLVQSVYKLTDGSGLALTTGRYYTPSGRCVQRPYNGSLYDYYNPRKRKNVPVSEADVKYTLGKRKVYGGGGIIPDVEQKARKLNRFELTLVSKDVFFKFANLAVQGKFPSIPFQELSKTKGNHLEINDAVVKDFRDYIESIKVSFSEEDFNANLEFVRRGIKAEVATRLYGVLEGFKIRAEGDELLLKAIDLMPQARSILLKTKSLVMSQRARGRSGAFPADDSTN